MEFNQVPLSRPRRSPKIREDGRFTNPTIAQVFSTLMTYALCRPKKVGGQIADINQETSH
ncbi:hypothetical protein MKW92_021110, partial [Papaver armeniacum]